MNWKQDRGLIGDLLDLAVRLLAVLEAAEPGKAADYSVTRSALYQLRVQCLRSHNGSAEIWLKAAAWVKATGPAGEMLALAMGFADDMAETERLAEIARQEAEAKRKRAEEEAAQKKAEAQAAALKAEADRKAEQVRLAEEKTKADRDAREQRRVAAEKTRKEEADRVGNRAAEIAKEKARTEPADSSG